MVMGRRTWRCGRVICGYGFAARMDSSKVSGSGRFQATYPWPETMTATAKPILRFIAVASAHVNRASKRNRIFTF